MIKRKKVYIVLPIVLSIILIIAVGHKFYSMWDANMRRAQSCGNGFEFDGKKYVAVNFREAGDYTETYKIVCKSEDGVWTIYEIKEYPEHEYLVARCGWEAMVMKRVS